MLNISTQDDNWNHLLAEAIYKIGRHRFKELLLIKMHTGILIELITLCSNTIFSQLTEKALSKLLLNKDEKVRKACAIKAIQSCNKTKLQSILTQYLTQENNRYYNVIYWLDFGVSLQKLIINQAIARISI